MSESSHLETPGVALDRRAFLGGVGLAAGAAIAAAMLPVSIARAVEAEIATTADQDGLWSVDVICGHWPPYSHPIPYGRPEVVATASLVSVDPMLTLDQMLVA